MNNEILINETNFKKFSKRLLKEIKETDQEKINLSETHNILSRVLSKKDYNDMKKHIDNNMKKHINNKINPEIFNESIFFENFLKDKNNLVIAEVKNGSFSLNTFFYEDDFKNDVLENFQSVDYNLINKTKINISSEDLKYLLRKITNNLYNNNRCFDFEYNIDSVININDNGTFSEHKIKTCIDPFIKEEFFHNSLYVKSLYFKKKNSYILIISKCKEVSIQRLFMQFIYRKN